MTFSDVVAYLYARLPNAERTGLKSLKPGLAKIEALCAALGNPHRQFRSIHVGGTNGKGSTAHILAAIYQAAGYRVGLHTSPHLKSLTERARINGQPMSEAAVIDFVTTHRSLIESVGPSFFEITVAMTFDYFARQSVDLAIIEVGLGGRLDSTNIIIPELSVITNVGFDHTDLLGNTLPKIAVEKAGIIKPGVPVVIGETQTDEVMAVWRWKAQQTDSRLIVADEYTKLKDLGIVDGFREVMVSGGTLPGAERFRVDLLGGYQLRNIATALTAVGCLQARFRVGTIAVATGLAAVARITGLRGRWQVLRRSPLVVVDTAHNRPGVQAMLETLTDLRYLNLHIIWGMLEDKDVPGVLSLLPIDARYYFCRINTPRGFSADGLQVSAADYGLTGTVYADVNAALTDVLLRFAAADDLVLVSGSTYLAADLTDNWYNES